MAVTNEMWGILITGLILTWGIGLFLPLLLRFVIFKKPLSGWKVAGYTFLCFLFDHIMFFQVVNPDAPKNSNQLGMFILIYVSYRILRIGHKKQKEENEEEIEI